ncbi:MAG: BlaI/MecI/CopY family transcriptional regulator [Oscillospiraceae bacterium]|nr:BlaI/MecI/CopY family transcriptional regulator [Oscillospiraceae bacterium]
MEKESVSLSDAEWKVMEELWNCKSATGRELCEQMDHRCGWNRSTTLTLLRRMEGKGAVESAQEGSVKVFRPLLRREEAALRETESFLSRVYQGSLSMMVSTLSRKQALSRKEIDELYALLREAEVKTDDQDD